MAEPKGDLKSEDGEVWFTTAVFRWGMLKIKN